MSVFKDKVTIQHNTGTRLVLSAKKDLLKNRYDMVLIHVLHM